MCALSLFYLILRELRGDNLWNVMLLYSVLYNTVANVENFLEKSVLKIY